MTQLGFIATHSPVNEPAYLLFLKSVPHNFYCLFALLLAAYAITAADAVWRLYCPVTGVLHVLVAHWGPSLLIVGAAFVILRKRALRKAP